MDTVNLLFWLLNTDQQESKMNILKLFKNENLKSRK